jgi:hypothetical protein
LKCITTRVYVQGSFHGPKVIAQPEGRGKGGGKGRQTSEWRANAMRGEVRIPRADPCNRCKTERILCSRTQGMISKLHLFAAALAGALICSAAGAQVRNSSSPVRHFSAHAKPAARASANTSPAVATGPQSSQFASVIQISPNGRIASGFVPSGNSLSFDSLSGVPGLGFDFPHLAAIGGGLPNRFQHFGHDGQRGQGSFVPIFFGGYPYYYDDPGADQQDQQAAQPAQPQPQIMVIQQPAPAQQAADSGSDAVNISAPASESEAAPSVPDVGDFILVRRDGRILFASVFSVVGAQLQYVTPEGIRHSLAMADLDSDATQQMNEARGTTVQIRN